MSSLLLQTSFSTRRQLSGLSLRVVASSALSTPQQQQHLIRTKHTVRIILKDDLPNGKAYKGDVITVAAGYARNYLVPKKIALYATRQNFARLGLRDPDLETAEERQARLAREAIEGQDEDLKAADLLKNYLRNKVLKIWRNVEPITERMHPGMVDAKAVRQKLSKQLKIDLEDHEHVHLIAEPVVHAELETDDDVEQVLQQHLGSTSATEKCETQVKELGEYLARIALKGGFMVPLKVEVLKR